MQEEQSYYDSLGIVNDTSEGSEYAKSMKNFFFWGPRLLPDKDYKDYRQTLLNYAQTYQPPVMYQENRTPKWHLIGPSGNSSYTNINFTGQIHYIYFPNPSNFNEIFACSPTGGLFISENGGNTWKNAGTDKGLPKSGISSITIDNNNFWYVTTGNGESFRHHIQWQTAIGFYRSTDAGKSWHEIGLENYAHPDGMRKVIEVEDNNFDSTRLIVTTTTGLYQTKNANKANPVWDTLVPGEFYDVIQAPDNYNLAFASGSNSTGVYKINLATDTYEQILNPDTIIADSVRFAYTRRISLNISPDKPDYMYVALVGRYAFSRIYRYKISEKKWVYRGVFNIGYARALGWTLKTNTENNDVMDIYAKNVNQGVLLDTLSDVNNKTEYYSGVKYILIDDSHDDCHYLYINPVTRKIWQGNDAGVYKGVFVDDTTIQWKIKNYGLSVANINNIDVDSTGFFVSSGQYDDHSSTYITNDGINWKTSLFITGDGYQTQIFDKTNYYVSGQWGFILKEKVNDKEAIITQYFPAIDDSCNLTGGTAHYANFETYYQFAGNYLYMTGEKEIRRYDLTNKKWSSFSQFSDNNLYPEMGCNRSGTWRIEIFNSSTMYVSTYGTPFGNFNYFHVYKYFPNNQNKKWIRIEGQPDSSAWVYAMKYDKTNPLSSLFVAMGNHIYRVHWTDNNVQAAIWDNITYNLNLNRIQHINGIAQDYNGLYIATDGGVFFKKHNTLNWDGYNFNLPNVNVKDIKLANHAVYVGTYGRGVWYASSHDCDITGDTIHIWQNTTYSTNKIVMDVIDIHPGATLTVTRKLSMGLGAKIIVERGAKLDVNGGTLTKECPDLWPGIEVWGNAYYLQDTVHQGRVVLRNNAKLEYAVTGIATIKNNGSNNDRRYTGGIINAENAIFLDNETDVSFYPWDDKITQGFIPVDNKSYFKNCTFTTDTAFYFYKNNQYDTSTVVHVELKGVRGVLFQNNRFENTVSLSFVYADKRGIGIVSWNSGFYAKNNSSTKIGNRFVNLYYGIKTYAHAGFNKKILIDRNSFEHNITGCYLGAETFASVIRNTFDVTRMDNKKPNGYCGLYLDAGTGYQVEENKFYSSYYPVFSQTYSTSYGIIVNNSGPEDNFIYNNKFHNISWATQAQNQNRSKDGLPK